ncbi:MAG: biopolymer transporter ExbD [Myxococcota bacterium]
MRRERARDEDEGDIDITPMIDIVFIMLIFFIVTASFVKEAGIEVMRPDAVTAQAKPRASILIAIDATDNVWVDKKQVDIRAVRGNVERLLAENPEGQVVVQADMESKNEILVKVMDAAREAGAEDVSISADPGN